MGRDGARFGLYLIAGAELGPAFFLVTRFELGLLLDVGSCGVFS
jgi:hypothetical protein